MLFPAVLVGLLAGSATSKSLKYTIPASMKLADDCVTPGEYEIANFITFAGLANGTSNTTSFYFTDVDTGISTCCQRNSTSTPSTPNPNLTPRWPCDNTAVEFMYQANGLTVIEAVCPGNTATNFEASGLTTFDLDCTTTSKGTSCVSKESLVADNFTSLQPRPS
ncbi:uncharacterized protein BCR38DRAFT_484067 [Pseudomassariella vexata]|uniref:AA1-like domain-containing protein n=1 Tax=Pseudomassariella vexata TaxID=1141098 RepID=A0A1Y2E4F1_9PEZI|nr:uncharacterized protein BCR38DRAFT_484067 [Pseudomassariella vexata]ORY66438.1 hypothetical protein BCR38DRAFT_484067 [Pseudomassariella vexata]